MIVMMIKETGFAVLESQCSHRRLVSIVVGEHDQKCFGQSSHTA